MRLELSVAPSVEPVTLAEAKAHCRIEHSDDDALVTALIIAARQSVEDFTNRALVNQTWKQFFDACELPFAKREIWLRKVSVNSITSVKAYAADDTATTVPSIDYFKSGDRVVLKEGKSWPSHGRQFDAVEIEYVAGYGAVAANVPAPIRQAILMLVAHYYENREAGGDPVVKEVFDYEVPFGVRAILMPFRVYQIL